MVLSLEALTRWISSLYKWILTTFPQCSFKWDIIYLDFISQTLTSPSPPPEHKNFKFFESYIFDTSFLCALSILQMCLPFTVANILIFSSSQPEITTSSLYWRHIGTAVFCTVHLAVTSYVDTSQSLMVPSMEQVANLSEIPGGYAT